jgi:hypothetical protein
MSNETQYGTPIISPGGDGEAFELERVSLTGRSDDSFNESWIQERIFKHPKLLPIDQIEPVFGPLYPLCRELRTSVGNLDVLYVNDRGFLTLVECKLWRNPEARRKVVGQILDYAQALSRWSYEDLDQAVANASGAGLVANLRQQGVEVDEKKFIDQTAKYLKKGRFLLLIVGDGIHEEVEKISDFLQDYANLNFAFALVEEAVFRMPVEGGGYLVQPRVLCKTYEVPRFVVEVRGDGVEVSTPPRMEVASATRSTSPRRGTISEQEYYQNLSEVQINLPENLNALFEQAAALGLELQWGTGKVSRIVKTPYRVLLRDEERNRESRRQFNFGVFRSNGFYGNNSCEGRLGRKYLRALAEILPDTEVSLRDNEFNNCVVKTGGERVKIADLLAVKDAWLALIENFLPELEANKVEG